LLTREFFASPRNVDNGGGILRIAILVFLALGTTACEGPDKKSATARLPADSGSRTVSVPTKKGTPNTSVKLSVADIAACPLTRDAFISQPGRLQFGNEPTDGQYVTVAFTATSVAPQRVLIRQDGRVVARFYGDLDDPRKEAAFVAASGAIEYEFQQCLPTDQNELQWFAYASTTTDESQGNVYQNTFRSGGTANFVMRWGPGIVAPPPPIYVHVDGKSKCGGFGYKVATNYAYGWVTSTADRNGPKRAVPEIVTSFTYEERGGTISHGERNTSESSAAEQFRGIGIPVCVCYNVTAVAKSEDGTEHRPTAPKRVCPD
jgi:hypothetical protein